MTNNEACKLIEDRMCFGRGVWTEHHHPVIDDYWEAGSMAIKALVAQPKYIEQLRWERDTAIQQLNKLGYGLGEEIRTDIDAISRQSVLADIESEMERIEKRTVYEEGYGKIGFVKAGTVVEHSVEIRNPKEIEYRDLDGRLKALDAIWTMVQAKPSLQPTFEEVPATTVIKEMSTTTTHYTFLWLDIFEKMNEMGYAICKRKKM